MTKRKIMTAACAGTLAVVSLLCGCGTKDKMHKRIAMEEQRILMPYEEHARRHEKRKRPSLPPPPPPADLQEKDKAEPNTQPPATQPTIQPRK